jgi:hypothetical protein
MKALAQHQIRCSRSFRSLHVRFAQWAADAVKAGMDANKQIQVSDGVGKSGGTENGRGSHPLMHGDIAGWVGRAFARKTK